MLRVVRDSGCFLDLNAHPERLGLLDTHCRLVRDEGVLVAIGSAAHAAGGAAPVSAITRSDDWQPKGINRSRSRCIAANWCSAGAGMISSRLLRACSVGPGESAVR